MLIPLTLSCVFLICMVGLHLFYLELALYWFVIIPTIVFLASNLLFNAPSIGLIPEEYRLAKFVSLDEKGLLNLSVNGVVSQYQFSFINLVIDEEGSGSICYYYLSSLLRNNRIYIVTSINHEGIKIYVDGKNVAIYLLSNGCAWLSTKTVPPYEYIYAFGKAVENRRGVFRNPNLINPAFSVEKPTKVERKINF